MNPDNIILKNIPEQPKDIWSRITENTLQKLCAREDMDNKSLEKARKIIDDENFKNKMKSKWQEQTLSENIEDDPAEQEKLWEKGLAQIIIDEIRKD